jgi:hypothetical protein
MASFVPAQDKTWNEIQELDFAKKIMDLESKENLSDNDKKKLNNLKQQLRSLIGK